MLVAVVPPQGYKKIAVVRESWIALVFALLVTLGRPALGGEPIRVGTWDVKSDPSVIVSTAVLKRAYQALNQPIEFVELPARRALTMLLDAQLDANVHRAATMFSPAHPLALSNSLTHIAPALDQTPVYHTLSSQQRELAERLNVVLEKMRSSGELKDIQKRALATNAD
jgi:ABC-type amino acid transport substrate-binding protein